MPRIFFRSVFMLAWRQGLAAVGACWSIFRVVFALRPYGLLLAGASNGASRFPAEGVERTTELLAALGNGHDNLFLVITASFFLNPNMRIIARGSEPSVVDKMLKAGADEVVLPESIGGMRMVSLMLRPVAVGFIDQMLRTHEVVVRVEEVLIASPSPFVGKRLAELRLPQEWNLLVVACQQPDGSLLYNPSGDLILQPGMLLFVMGDGHKLGEFRCLAQASAAI